MKKLFLTIGLVAAGSLAYGQGTVQFSNGALVRNSTAATPDGTVSNAVNKAQVPLTPGLIEYGLFYGIGQSTSLTLLSAQFGVNSTSSAGIISSPADSGSALSTVALPGTNPGDANIFVQVFAWAAKFGTDYQAAHAAFNAFDSTSFWGQTGVQNINALGPSAGPGVAIWQSATGTNPRLLNALTILQPVPEPATFALAGLGAATLLIFRRRK